MVNFIVYSSSVNNEQNINIHDEAIHYIMSKYFSNHYFDYNLINSSLTTRMFSHCLDILDCPDFTPMVRSSLKKEGLEISAYKLKLLLIIKMVITLTSNLIQKRDSDNNESIILDQEKGIEINSDNCKFFLGMILSKLDDGFETTDRCDRLNVFEYINKGLIKKIGHGFYIIKDKYIVSLGDKQIYEKLAEYGDILVVKTINQEAAILRKGVLYTLDYSPNNSPSYDFPNLVRKVYYEEWQQGSELQYEFRDNRGNTITYKGCLLDISTGHNTFTLSRN